MCTYSTSAVASIKVKKKVIQFYTHIHSTDTSYRVSARVCESGWTKISANQKKSKKKNIILKAKAATYCCSCIIKEENCKKGRRKKNSEKKFLAVKRSANEKVSFSEIDCLSCVFVRLFYFHKFWFIISCLEWANGFEWENATTGTGHSTATATATTTTAAKRK